jgi:hypothetical protein
VRKAVAVSTNSTPAGVVVVVVAHELQRVVACELPTSEVCVEGMRAIRFFINLTWSSGGQGTTCSTL